MKVIVGKGHANEEGQRWFAVVPDDATSSQDPQRTRVLAPECLDQDQQGMWIEGYANAVKRFSAFDDLLAACKAAVDACPCCHGDLATDCDAEPCQGRRGAIAKAEGTENAPTPS